MAEVHWGRISGDFLSVRLQHSCWKHNSACSRRTFSEYCCRQNILKTKCLTQCFVEEIRGNLFLFWFFFFQLCGVKEGIPPLQGATLQLLGQALCGGSASLCFYLQQWQRSCWKRSHKLIHSSGGIQWGSTGNGEGQSESCCLFIHKARTLQVAVHLYHQGCHLCSEENGSELWGHGGSCPQSSQFVQGLWFWTQTLTAVTHQISS